MGPSEFETDIMKTRHYDYDIIVIGGGPVGMALALALNGSGVSVLLLEAKGLPVRAEDPRPLALSHGSRLILQRLGVWKALPDVTPIKTIHISNRGGFGRTVLTSAEAGVPALGYVINYHDLFRTMHEALETCAAEYLTGAQVTGLETREEAGEVEFQHGGSIKKKTARLLVLADGGHLSDKVDGVTQHVRDYGQWAIVARVRTDRFENLETAGGVKSFTRTQTGIAYERFTSDGPVALLPSGKYFALVWTVSPSAAQEILGLDDVAFLARLHDHFGDRLGRFVEAGKRSGFPLVLKYATPVTAGRVVLAGNAAQTLHPVAGQGFNLGLRDAWELAEEVVASPSRAGKPAMLARYRDKRGMDSSMGRIFTDSLVKLFSNDIALLNSARGMGLSALDCLPPAKRFVARRMMFGIRG